MGMKSGSPGCCPAGWHSEGGFQKLCRIAQKLLRMPPDPPSIHTWDFMGMCLPRYRNSLVLDRPGNLKWFRVCVCVLCPNHSPSFLLGYKQFPRAATRTQADFGDGLVGGAVIADWNAYGGEP